MIVHYGEYLSLKERSKKLLEGESLEGKKIEVYAYPNDEAEVIPLVAVVELNPLTPRQPNILHRENMPKPLLEKMLQIIKESLKNGEA